jgi:hypothetical protein
LNDPESTHPTDDNARSRKTFFFHVFRVFRVFRGFNCFFQFRSTYQRQFNHGRTQMHTAPERSLPGKPVLLRMAENSRRHLLHA